jgi:hypothetical protein
MLLVEQIAALTEQIAILTAAVAAQREVRADEGAHSLQGTQNT